MQNRSGHTVLQVLLKCQSVRGAAYADDSAIRKMWQALALRGQPFVVPGLGLDFNPQDFGPGAQVKGQKSCFGGKKKDFFKGCRERRQYVCIAFSLTGQLLWKESRLEFIMACLVVSLEQK